MHDFHMLTKKNIIQCSFCNCNLKFVDFFSACQNKYPSHAFDDLKKVFLQRNPAETLTHTLKQPVTEKKYILYLM